QATDRGKGTFSRTRTSIKPPSQLGLILPGEDEGFLLYIIASDVDLAVMLPIRGPHAVSVALPDLVSLKKVQIPRFRGHFHFAHFLVTHIDNSTLSGTVSEGR